MFEFYQYTGPDIPRFYNRLGTFATFRTENLWISEPSLSMLEKVKHNLDVLNI